MYNFLECKKRARERVIIVIFTYFYVFLSIFVVYFAGW